MTARRRFIEAVIRSAELNKDLRMPWDRGQRQDAASRRLPRQSARALKRA
ncbi:MAG: hypothetical protein HLUCCA24_02635 [Rhodobacteraceae bacterium HLUCCA24]|nr:MAG: hypothetical protein HLUCCA24_02635 [Rhodobacteraceae bacterium HLUCCA24]